MNDMNPFISKEALNQLREDYPKGAIVVLDKMDDAYRPVPAGTKGTVKHIDDAGTVHVSWENGQGLGLVYGEDEYHLYKEGEKK